jgi:hypothetical protein
MQAKMAVDEGREKGSKGNEKGQEEKSQVAKGTWEPVQNYKGRDHGKYRMREAQQKDCNRACKTTGVDKERTENK